MFMDELYLQLVGNYYTAIDRREAQTQESDLLRMQDVGQHHTHTTLSVAAISNYLCLVQQVSEEAPGHNEQTHATQVKEDHVLVFHMHTSASASM